MDKLFPIGKSVPLGAYITKLCLLWEPAQNHKYREVNYNYSDLMVDLPKLRKEAPEPPGPSKAPEATGPDSDMDLPAPKPPVQASPNTPQGTGAQAPPPMTGPPSPEEVVAKVTGEARKEPVPSKPGMGAPEPLKLPEAKPLEPERPGEKAGSDHIGIHTSPPVFIKIDKYTEIVKNINKLKSYALSLRDTLDALADIEKELTTGISIAHKALDDFNAIIAVMDSKLLRANAIKDMEVSSTADVDNYVKGIYSQMEKIKSELKGL